MFRTLTIASLCLALAAPVAAQKMGGANRNAPTCTQGISFKAGGSLRVEYTAITWASGAWAKSEAVLERARQVAERNPLGKVTITGTIQLAGKKIPAGSYKLYFTPGNDQGTWIMHCAAIEGDTKVAWRLVLKTGENVTKRLSIVVTPGDDANSADLRLSFGKQSASATATPVKDD